MSTTAAPTAASSPNTRAQETEKDRPTASPPTNQPSKPTLSSRLSSWSQSHLPPYLHIALQTRRTWKTFLRCLVVFIVMMVLLVDDRTLSVMGQAGFFGLIISLMLPPNMAVALFLMAALMLVVGVCLGWAWGCAAMAASLRARSTQLLASQYTIAQSKLVPGVAPDAQFQSFIFQGLFLDPGSSAVYGVFFFFGTFGLALVRAYIPRLTLVAVFGTIVLDVMCSYGPLFPSAQYTLATLFLLPTAIYVAVALSAILLIFPESMNHVWLTSLTEQILIPAQSILSAQLQILSLPTSPSPSPSDPSDPSSPKSWPVAWSEIREQQSLSGRGMIEATQALLGQTGMTELEVSRGRLGPGDLKSVGGKLMGLASRTLGLMSFMILVEERNKDYQTYEVDPSPANGEGGEEGEMVHDSSPFNGPALTQPKKPKSSSHLSPKDGTPPAAGTGNITPQSAQRFDALRRKVRTREQEHGHDLENLVPLLREGTRPLLEACETALKGRVEWLQYVNSTRWHGSKSEKETESMYLAGKAQADAVRAALSKLRGEERMRVLEPFEKYFDPATGELVGELKARTAGDRMFAANSLFLCFVFGTTLKAYAEVLLELLDLLVELERKRPRNRLWFPSGFGKIGRKILARRGQEGTAFENGVPAVVAATEDDATVVDGDSVDDYEDEELLHEMKAQPRDPDSSPPRTWLGRAYTRLTALFRWFMKPEALFALRYSVVSIALFAFTVHPVTAYFNYANRGLWALIMAQTGMGVYAGEQIANFLVRLSGTLIGLVLGMVAWYIGAAKGNGNPYGIVIITTAIVAPFLFIRVCGPQQQIVIYLMAGTMIIFVVGYSWVDSHIQTIQNAGVGVFLAWRRAVLVIVGFACAFVVMVLPYPTSARQVVRKTMASTLEELGNLLALELDACIQSTHDTREHWTRMKGKGIKIIGGRMFAISQQLQAIMPSMTTAKFEPTFKGPWPAETYQRLMRAQWRMVQSLALLNASLADLDASWLHTLIHKTPFFNPNFLTDVSSTIYIIARSLRHGYPVPATITPLRERLIYHDRHANALGGPGSTQEEVFREELDAGPDRIEGASIGLRSMTLTTLKDEQLVFHSTAIIGLAHLIRTVDEITEIARELCGTTQFYPGLDVMRDEYLGMEEAAIRQMEKRV